MLRRRLRLKLGRWYISLCFDTSPYARTIAAITVINRISIITRESFTVYRGDGCKIVRYWILIMICLGVFVLLRDITKRRHLLIWALQC